MVTVYTAPLLALTVQVEPFSAVIVGVNNKIRRSTALAAHKWGEEVTVVPGTSKIRPCESSLPTLRKIVREHMTAAEIGNVVIVLDCSRSLPPIERRCRETPCGIVAGAWLS